MIHETLLDIVTCKRYLSNFPCLNAKFLIKYFIIQTSGIFTKSFLAVIINELIYYLICRIFFFFQEHVLDNFDYFDGIYMIDLSIGQQTKLYIDRSIEQRQSAYADVYTVKPRNSSHKNFQNQTFHILTHSQRYYITLFTFK